MLSRHFLLCLAILVAWPFVRERPDFAATPKLDLEIDFAARSSASPPGWTLYGSWELSAAIDRFAGLSGLDCSEGRLQMVTDLGDIVALPFPTPRTKSAVASIFRVPVLYEGEAILARGTQRIVAQENGSQLIVIEDGVTTARIDVRVPSPNTNLGIEALVDWPERGSVLALHELGERAVEVREGRVVTFAVEGADGFVTGGARHPDGRAFVLMRKMGLTGFSASIAAIEVDADTNSVRIGAPLALPLPVHANAEGLCVEPRGAGGSTRLWVVSDDNGLPVMAQRLVAWDVPDDAWPKAPEGADD